MRSPLRAPHLPATYIVGAATAAALLWSPLAARAAIAATPAAQTVSTPEAENGAGSAPTAPTPTLPPSPAAPEAPLAEPDAPSAVAAHWQLTPGLQAAAARWLDVLHRPPKLVSLAREVAADAPAQDKLKARLQVLGDKTFSNREWHSHWGQQAKLASALADGLAAAPLHGVDRAAREHWIADLRAWAALAADKAANQDRYLKAIETERDAVGDCIEAMLEAADPIKSASSLLAEGASPYQRRQHQLRELLHRIEVQKTKRMMVAADRGLLDHQIASSKLVVDALSRDVALARREHEVAKAAAAVAGPWQASWQRVATAATEKTVRLEDEAGAEASRLRARSVELDLLRSQERYRDERIAELNAEHAALNGVRPWLGATRDTFMEWLTSSAWRIFIGLLLVWIAVRLVLRLVMRGLRLWTARAEGDPDDASDDDTRTLTIVTVISGVARPAIYVVAALVALEIVGVNTGPLLGSVAILGLAISFGSQNLVRDVVNGFFILMEHQYAAGEIVEISGKTGTVERITMRSTWIRQANGDLHIVPNGQITVVSNLTRGWSKAIVDVGVAYDADLDRVQAVCDEVGAGLFADEAWREHLGEAPAWVGVTELGDSSVVVRVAATVRAGEPWAVRRELNRRLKLAFDAAGIEIPFPQRVVWTKSAAEVR